MFCMHCEDAGCVMVCPTKARLFGDSDDPESDVSPVTRERGGYPLMPERGTGVWIPRIVTSTSRRTISAS
jgi:Fe-S-cluster-containing dehydrogenase component